jgi:hypothetical protein
MVRQEASMLTPHSVPHGFSEFIASKMTASADDRILWQHVEQARLIECPDQDEAYFDMIMRVRRHRPARRCTSA